MQQNDEIQLTIDNPIAESPPPGSKKELPASHRPSRIPNSPSSSSKNPVYALEDFAHDKQRTNTPKHHVLDNSHNNFNNSGQWLVYDTRDGSTGPGVECSKSIEKVNVFTGQEVVILEDKEAVAVDQDHSAPGIGAASFAHHLDVVVCIHGPPRHLIPELGFYSKSNRRACEVKADGSGKFSWLDRRDVPSKVNGEADTDPDWVPPPGAHRGGTHRHEYTRSGNRLGFTYDDDICKDYGRSIGYMELLHKDAPDGAQGYSALLVEVHKESEATPGQIVDCRGDCWVGPKGHARAFVGKVCNNDSYTFTQSLFVVDIPFDVDITTATEGTLTSLPKPPEGLVLRRITTTPVVGQVACNHDGDTLAYYAADSDGKLQLWIIYVEGSDQDTDEKMRPVQATFFEEGVKAEGLRWATPTCLCYINAKDQVCMTAVQPGKDSNGGAFGTTIVCQHTPHADLRDVERFGLTVNKEGTLAAYNMKAESGYVQIYVVALPSVFTWDCRKPTIDKKTWVKFRRHSHLERYFGVGFFLAACILVLIVYLLFEQLNF